MVRTKDRLEMYEGRVERLMAAEQELRERIARLEQIAAGGAEAGKAAKSAGDGKARKEKVKE
ncbi:MAG: hypothetical protein II008_05995 [Oscillospiraceae bacterium]|jgi:chaperonin cofactor prefoldin|nr:hypothetical protein [Oscillospiraceae bacterium]